VPLLTSEGEEGQQLGSSPAPAIIAAGSSDSGSSSGIGSGAGSGRKRSGRLPGSSGLLQQPSSEEIQGLSLPQVHLCFGAFLAPGGHGLWTTAAGPGRRGWHYAVQCGVSSEEDCVALHRDPRGILHL
jgi:hypothetical protein